LELSGILGILWPARKPTPLIQSGETEISSFKATKPSSSQSAYLARVGKLIDTNSKIPPEHEQVSDGEMGERAEL